MEHIEVGKLKPPTKWTTTPFTQWSSVKPYQFISTNMCISKVHKRGRRSTIPTKTMLLCMVVQLLKFSLIYQKSAKFWVPIPTKKSSWISRVKFGMHPHTHTMNWDTNTCSSRQTKQPQSKYLKYLQAGKHCIITNKKSPVGRGWGESLWPHELVHHKTFAARFCRAIILRAPSDHWRLGSSINWPSINLIKIHEHLLISCQMNDIGGN